MTLGNPLPWFFICAACLLLGAAFAATPFYRQRAREETNRFATIDGLRGFLALAVFGGHAVNMYTWRADGVWSAQQGGFYAILPGAGVALFFQITAFLFWLRVLQKGAAFDVPGFFASRVRRLVPMYLASVVVVLVVIAAATGFTPHV